MHPHSSPCATALLPDISTGLGLSRVLSWSKGSTTGSTAWTTTLQHKQRLSENLISH